MGLPRFFQLAALQDCDHAGGAAAAEILREPEPVTFQLAVACFAAELLHDVADLCHPRRAHRMPLRLQSAAGIDRQSAIAPRSAFEAEESATAPLHESEVFHGDNLGDRETVVQ